MLRQLRIVIRHQLFKVLYVFLRRAHAQLHRVVLIEHGGVLLGGVKKLAQLRVKLVIKYFQRFLRRYVRAGVVFKLRCEEGLALLAVCIERAVCRCRAAQRLKPIVKHLIGIDKRVHKLRIPCAVCGAFLVAQLVYIGYEFIKRGE